MGLFDMPPSSSLDVLKGEISDSEVEQLERLTTKIFSRCVFYFDRYELNADATTSGVIAFCNLTPLESLARGVGAKISTRATDPEVTHVIFNPKDLSRHDVLWEA